jgi:glyoxylase-like metal-dependent hydrolase (beta-lactamase superfamily II)
VTALLERAGAALGGLRLDVDEVAGGIRRLRVSSRMTRANGMEATCYLAGTVLIDTGFVQAGRLVLAELAGRRLDALCLTHHHEDHCGVAAAVAARHGCPIYLRNPGRRFEEGLTALKPYRLLWWGVPLPYEPREMPAVIETAGHVLRSIPIPGHSATHTALHDERTGAVFVGDLYITGGATAVMSHENPYESIDALRRVAALRPAWLLNGHGLALAAPATALATKADRIERAAAAAVALHRAGLPTCAIVQRLFPRGRLNDLAYAVMTQREFSRANFVRACVRFAR